MKKSKTLRVILLVLILILLFLTIRDTYSKYVTQTKNSSTLDISKWKILLNNQDIMNNIDFSDDIALTYENNEHIAQDFVAPTTKGTFSLELESTGTELPYKYEIQITDDKPYVVTLNNTTPGDDTKPYLYDLSLAVTNSVSDHSGWEMEIELPENIIENRSVFSIQNSTYNETYAVENNILKITSPEDLSQNTEITLNLILAFENEINFEISNISINGTKLYNPTDRIADFKITSYTLNGTNYIIPAHESKITGTVIPPTDLTEEVIHDFTFTVEWYDGKNNVYDNFEDVEAIKQGLPATIPITLSVTQILDTTT